MSDDISTHYTCAPARVMGSDICQSREWSPDWRPRKADRPRCGAKTRRGTPCAREGSGRGGRCPNHGGLCTGPTTQEGRQRCIDATKRRWQAWRAARAASASPADPVRDWLDEMLSSPPTLPVG